jgi:hypothetical protein
MTIYLTVAEGVRYMNLKSRAPLDYAIKKGFIKAKKEHREVLVTVVALHRYFRNKRSPGRPPKHHPVRARGSRVASSRVGTTRPK